MTTYAVEIFDDEIRPKKWKRVVLSSALDRDVFRSSLGKVGNEVRYTTEDLVEAEAKKQEMIQQGWKTRIKMED